MNLKPHHLNVTPLVHPNTQEPSAPALSLTAEHPREIPSPAADNVIDFPATQEFQTAGESPDQRPTRYNASEIHPIDPERCEHQRLGESSTAALQRAKAAGRKSALLVFRLSEHGRFVETFGHRIGSALNRLVAERLQDCLRIGDVLESIAEDEFVIVLDHLEQADEVAVAAQRLVARCTGSYVLEGLRLHVHAVVGIALYPTDANTPSELMRYARIALRQADAGSVSPYQFFCKDQLKQLREQAWMTAELEQALEQDRLVLHYQPQYEVNSQRIVGMEALLRLETESGELIFPDRFIELAEDNGLIVPLGHWVIRKACQQLRCWREQGFGPLRMAVNLSPSQLVDPQLIDVIREAVEGAGLCYGDLELEITEQRMAEHLPSVENVLTTLSAQGIRIAVDDFGTGYSSLAYLARLPLQAMKIDRSFLTAIEEDPRARRLATSIIAMGKALDLEIIAEGVETQEQQQFLEAVGCHLGQGYGFARPQRAEDIEPLLKAHESSKKTMRSVEK
ncbi:MAG: GGDEF domain-containing phosphodiesterase [Pseudomonadota bacterium]